MEKFKISSQECQILLSLAKSSSLREAADLVDCDAGGLLRKVQQLASKFGVVQKVNRKWILTQDGEAIARWTQDSIKRQNELLGQNLTIRIASTTWFAESVLISSVEKLRKDIRNLEKVQVLIPEKKLEKSILDGDCDFVIVCHPPEDPSIAHSVVREEPWTLVVSKELAELHKLNTNSITLNDLQEIPFVHHLELNPETFLPKDFKIKYGIISTNSLIAARSAMINNLGWSYVPKGLVLSELKSKKLLPVKYNFKMDRKICIWWLRGGRQGKLYSSILKSWIESSCSKF